MSMDLVVDANIVKGFFDEAVLELVPSLTGSARLLFDRVGVVDTVFLDEGGHIEQEWRSPVEPEWFDAWYAGLLNEGKAIEIPTNTCHVVRQRLETTCGFPRGSKDFWYIRTAKTVADHKGQAYVISEDMDLHEPAEKKANAGRRTAILHACNGRVVRLLRREGVLVRSIVAYMDSVSS